MPVNVGEILSVFVKRNLKFTAHEDAQRIHDSHTTLQAASVGGRCRRLSLANLWLTLNLSVRVIKHVSVAAGCNSRSFHILSINLPHFPMETSRWRAPANTTTSPWQHTSQHTSESLYQVNVYLCLCVCVYVCAYKCWCMHKYMQGCIVCSL